MAWNIPAAISVATDRTAAWFNAVMDSFSFIDQHAHSGADGDGSSVALSATTMANTWIPISSGGGIIPSTQETGGVLGHVKSYATSNNTTAETRYIYLNKGNWRARVFFSGVSTGGNNAGRIQFFSGVTFLGSVDFITNQTERQTMISVSTNALITISVITYDITSYLKLYAVAFDPV